VFAPSDSPRLERSLLKDQVTELLRDYIISGRILPGAKLAEREVSNLLGISRAPVRDALSQLEKEGLVVTKSNGRHVIELNERDIRELFQVRQPLERLAVELATKNTSPENRAALAAKLQEMDDAMAHKDDRAFMRSDVETHRLIWRQSDNRHLQEVLSAMVWPMFMFVAANHDHFDWVETLGLHENLVTSINSGDVQAARKSIERHTDDALEQSLRAYEGIQVEHDGSPRGGQS